RFDQTDVSIALRGLLAFMESSGYSLCERHLLAILCGDEVPARPADFVELASDYLELSPGERLALLAQVAYDILRQYLGPEFYAAIFRPATPQENDERAA